jgi:hypothetical protein
MELIAAAGYSWMMVFPHDFDPARSPGCAGATGRRPQAEPVRAG